jgi:non-specific protein-tyrosine kinase
MSIVKKLQRVETAGTSDKLTNTDQETQRKGWNSPAYTQSENIKLDPAVLVANRCICIETDALIVEHYKLLRTQILQRTRTKGWNTVMITSPNPGEGKTTTAINLALTFAREFSNTVLLVDADLKQQAIHKKLGYTSPAGLSDYLLYDKPMNDLIVWPGIEKLTIISGGNIIDNSTELLGSSRMQELVHEMKNRYDDRYVLFDVPPLLAVADAVAFAPLVDAILMVVDEGKTTNNDIKTALQMIPRDKFLGFAINRQELGRRYYADYYYRQRQ